MATQSTLTRGQLSNAVRPIRRPGIQRRPTASTVETPARKSPRLDLDRQALLVEMLPHVKRMAFKVREHLPSHVELDDLIANGIMGLADAISKFDTSKRVKLESYARYRIRGSILDGLRSVDPASRDLRQKNKKIRQAYRELENKLGRRVMDEEISAAMGMSLGQWHAALNEVQTVGPEFSARLTSAAPTAKKPSVDPAMLTGEDADPFELCYRRERREILSRALSHLREREREIIGLYYQQELTMKQIAGRMHIDESRVSQLHAAALVRLRATLKSLLHPHSGNGVSAPAPLAMAAGAGA